MKITVAMPTIRRVQPRTAQCLLELVARGGHDFHIVIAEEGYTTAENRNYIAVQAVNNGSDYLFSVDDDMTFESSTLDKLLEVDKPIVGVAYHPRTETGKCVKYLDEIHAVTLEQTDDPKYKVPFKCHATGTGIILIKTEVFKKTDRPWFMFEYLSTGQCSKGEDWYFCEKAKEFGFETWTEPRIKVGHLGEYIYK